MKKRGAVKKVRPGTRKAAARRTARGAGRPAAKRAAPARTAARQSVIPYIVVRGAAAAIDFYKRAFGAKEVMRMAGPGTTVMHAEIRIGDSVVFLADENPQWGSQGPQTLGGTHGSLHLPVKDVDAAVRKAAAAGATVKMPPANMFWGDRYAKLADPFGHEWGLAQTIEVLSPREMRKRGAAFMAQMASQGAPGAPAAQG